MDDILIGDIKIFLLISMYILLGFASGGILQGWMAHCIYWLTVTWMNGVLGLYIHVFNDTVLSEAFPLWGDVLLAVGFFDALVFIGWWMGYCVF